MKKNSVNNDWDTAEKFINALTEQDIDLTDPNIVQRLKFRLTGILTMLRQEALEELKQTTDKYRTVGKAISTVSTDYHAGMANTAAAIMGEIDKIR